MNQTPASVSDDLQWWRAHRDVAPADPAALRALLDRLQAWKAEHDEHRTQQPGPFLKLAWDAVFGDENGRVEDAIREVEDALAGR